MHLNRHTVLVPEAGTRADVSKALGQIRTANEGDAAFSGRLKHTDANKLGHMVLENSKDQNMCANIISF